MYGVGRDVDQRAGRHPRLHALYLALQRPFHDVDPLLVGMAVGPGPGAARHANQADLDALALHDGAVGCRVAGAGVDGGQLGEVERVASVAGLDRAGGLGRLLGHAHDRSAFLYGLFIRTSSQEGNGTRGSVSSVCSATRGPTPRSVRKSMTGANITRSTVSCWILWSRASRLAVSRSLAC